MTTPDDTPKTTRHRMAPEDRRAAILDAAQALFINKGWDAVTIADVLDAAGISKGGFYHHFTAKDDLLTGIVTRLTEQGLAAAEAARRETAGDALTKLNAFVAASMRWKSGRAEEMRVLADVLTGPGNEILYRRVLDATAAAAIPALEDLIADGIADGTFDVADARLTAEAIVGLSEGRWREIETAVAMASTGQTEQAAARIAARMRAEGLLCDRLLGVPPGSVSHAEPHAVRRMLAALAASPTSTQAQDRAASRQGRMT